MAETGWQRAAAACGVVVLLLAAAGTLGIWRIRWSGGQVDRATLQRRVRLLPAAVAERRALARIDVLAGRPGAAHSRLLGAARRAPFEAALRLEGAEAALHAGRVDAARAAAMRAVALAPTDPQGCYRAALVLLQLGDRRRAAPRLRCVVEHAPGRAEEIFDLAVAVYGGAEPVLERVTPRSVTGRRRFLDWAYSRARVDAAGLGWTALAASTPRAGDRLRHIDFLIARGEVRAADRLWGAAYGSRGPALVYDGDFEGDPVGAGFGWLLGRLPAARVEVRGGEAAAHGGRGLAVEFLGGNLDFWHVSQTIPVGGSRRYRLSALVRTEGVTSLAGPRLRVEPHASCSGLPMAEGPELRGTRAWGPVAIEFVTPRACQAVVIRLRRVPTRRLDRDLTGRLYLDDVRMTDLGPDHGPAA